MLYRRKPTIVKAEQFDPNRKPWPREITSWENEPARPRDMSWGYMMVKGSRVHVQAGDWVVRWDNRVWLVERNAFNALYEVLPGSEAASANINDLRFTETSNLQS